MGEAWVEVLSTEPVATAATLEVLQRHGIAARVERGSPHLRALAPGRRALADPDRIHVQTGDVPHARRVLAAHLAEGERRIRGHLRDLPGELAVGACLVTAIGFVATSAVSGPASAWPWAAGFALAAPLAWRRLRRH